MRAFRGLFFTIRPLRLNAWERTAPFGPSTTAAQSQMHPTADREQATIKEKQMKTNAIARSCALLMSVLFASFATVGVAVLMTASGEQSRTELSASAPARQSPGPATTELTQLGTPSSNVKRAL